MFPLEEATLSGLVGPTQIQIERREEEKRVKGRGRARDRWTDRQIQVLLAGFVDQHWVQSEGLPA